jgi:hypothetical protein
LGLSAYDIIVKYQTAFLATRQLGAQVSRIWRDFAGAPIKDQSMAVHLSDERLPCRLSSSAASWAPYHLCNIGTLFHELLHGFRFDLVAWS